VIVNPVTQNSGALRAIWELAIADVTKKRGGEELLLSIRGDVASEALLAYLVAHGCLWSASDDAELVGFVLCRNRVVETLYVDRHHRRRGVARNMLNELRAMATPPLDAFALPGDRATKSLYESIGWKARLLTMRGE
jgi:GNAT superfamily N-acetyltransferase